MFMKSLFHAHSFRCSQVYCLLLQMISLLLTIPELTVSCLSLQLFRFSYSYLQIFSLLLVTPDVQMFTGLLLSVAEDQSPSQHSRCSHHLILLTCAVIHMFSLLFIILEVQGVYSSFPQMFTVWFQYDQLQM